MRRLTGVLVGPVVAALWLVGCGSGSSTDEQEGGTPSETGGSAGSAGASGGGGASGKAGSSSGGAGTAGASAGASGSGASAGSAGASGMGGGAGGATGGQAGQAGQAGAAGGSAGGSAGSGASGSAGAAGSGEAGSAGEGGSAGQGGSAGEGGSSQGGSSQGGGGQGGGGQGGAGGSGCGLLGECNGTCVDLSSDAKNCGYCGNECLVDQSCVKGECLYACAAGLTQCGGVCVNLQQDMNNCGACGTACDKGLVCSSGACVGACPAPTVACGGACVNPQSDPSNCGGCGVTCGAGEACLSGQCQTQCQAGQMLCSGVCSDTATDPQNCGGCGKACSASEICEAGACKVNCVAPQMLCSGACVDTQANNQNCGGCGKACAAGTVCTSGACVLSCQVGQTDCSGKCVDLQQDKANCGACGTACSASEVCFNGACKLLCDAGQTACSGQCVNMSTDPQNCGSCGKACAAGEFCANGTCQLSCQPGQTACSGACTDVNTDPQNCGGCGKACAQGQSCVSGQCKLVCPAGQVACGNTCVDTQTDDKNCGGCGVACGANQVCSAGACVLTCKAQLLGTPVTDQWGFSWDGNERTTSTYASAAATCGAIGGRLPTATEVHRVSAARTSQIGQTANTNLLWTVVPYDTGDQVQAKLSDGTLSHQLATKNSIYRCVCPPADPPGFSGSDCVGASGPQCSTLDFDGVTHNIDSFDRAKLNASGAAWECSFAGGRLIDTGTLISAIRVGLPNGTAGGHWTADQASSNEAMTIGWNGTEKAWAAGANVSSAALATMGSVSFRCIGPTSELSKSPNAPASGYVAPTTHVAYDSADRAAQKWAASFDTCVFFGGHLASSGEYIDGIHQGLGGGANVALWTSDQTGYNGTQFLGGTIKWTAKAPSLGWNVGAGWAYKTATPGSPFRCAYFPVNDTYTGPQQAQCSGACFKVPAPFGAPATAPSMWLDALDRPATLLADAAADCQKSGGRLPTERDYVEAIRNGLPNGSTSYLFTSDFSHNTVTGPRMVQVVRWSQVEPSYDDQYSAYMTWSALNASRPYRCMWTNEAR